MLFTYSFVAYVIAHSCTKDKWNPVFTFFAIFAVRIVLSVVFTDSSLNMLGYVLFALLYFAILCLFTYGSVVGKIICPILQIIAYIASVFLASFLYVVIYGNTDPQDIFGSDNPNLEHLYFYLLRCIIFMVCGYIVAGILKVIYVKKDKHPVRNKLLFAYLSFFPVSHIFIIVFTITTFPAGEGSTTQYNTTFSVASVVLMLLIMLFDCFYPFILDRFERLTLENEKKEKRLLKNELDYQQAKLLSAEKDEFRKLRHDFKNILATAQGFIELDQPDKALQIIKKTQKDLSSVSGIVLCANSILNVVLSVAKQKADAQGIAFHVLVKESAVLKLDDYLVCRLMHNLLDNALEAAAAAAEKSVAVHIWIDAACFDIAVQNTCTSEEKRTKRSGDHGHGTAIIRQIVKQYMGTYTVTAENGTYLAKVQLSNASFSDE